MAFGRYDETLLPVREGMKQATQRGRDADLHQMELAAKSAKLRLDLQSIQENDMKLKVRGIQQRTLENNAKTEVAISEQVLANKDKIAKSKIQEINKTLLDSTSALNDAQNEQIARGMAGIVSIKEPEAKQQAYSKMLEQAKEMPGMKDFISKSGLTGDIKKDGNMVRYISAVAKETLSQRQAKAMAYMENELATDRMYTKGAIDMNLLNRKIESEEKIAALKAAAAMKKAAAEMINKDMRWSDPTNVVALDNAFIKIASDMEEMGFVTKTAIGDKTEDPESQVELNRMALGMMQEVKKVADIYRGAGVQADINKVTEQARKAVIGRVDLSGKYHEYESDALRSDKDKFFTTITKSLNIGGSADPSLVEAWKLATPQQKQEFLEAQWSSPSARSSYEETYSSRNNTNRGKR